MRLRGGLLMQLDPQEWTQISLLAGRPTEPLTAARIEELLAPGDSFIDVGAHVGWLSLIAARRVGPGGRVIAVDPQPYNCERILNNALANGFGSILVVPAALSVEETFIELPHQSSTDKSRLTLTGPGVNDTAARFLCPRMRLDSLVGRTLPAGRIKLVKVDVEGYELEVLQGAGEALARIDNVIYETLPEIDASLQHRIRDLLEEAGFELRTVGGRPWAPGEAAPENNVWARRAPSA